MTNNTLSYAQRVQALARTAAQHYHKGRMEDAELAAYEAGRFGTEIPEMVAENEFLKHHFERGAVDAVQDAADQERVDAITEAGFDPCATSRKPSSPSPF